MMDARKWLIENNYSDIANLIDSIIINWKMQGKKTRRNWWDMMSGNKNGKPKKISNIEIPVLRAAQIRQNKPITENALCRNIDEIVPVPNAKNRWNKK